MNSPVKVRIVENLCIACGLCREVCPEHAVHPKMQDIHHMYEVVEAECTGCGDCLPYCPEPGALQQFNPFPSCGELCSPSVLNTVLK